MLRYTLNPRKGVFEVDKRIKMIFASLCLGLMLMACTEERDMMPDLDLQEILDHQGIDDIRYGNGDDRDSSNMGGQ